MPPETTVFQRQRPFVVVWYRSLQVKVMASQVVHGHECYIFFFLPTHIYSMANCKLLQIITVFFGLQSKPGD